MAKSLLSVELWEQVLSLLPLQKRFPQGGCPPTGNREAIAGILFVLKPRFRLGRPASEIGRGYGMTYRRRLHDRQEAGIWQDLRLLLLSKLQTADDID